MLNIHTTYKTNAKGTGQVVAKAQGKQRTVAYDHSLRAAQNHANAAHALMVAMDLGGLPMKAVLNAKAEDGRVHYVIDA